MPQTDCYFKKIFYNEKRMIILASTSPRRKHLLKKLGVPFTIVASDFDEKFNPRFGPKKQAEFLSLQKAEIVAKRLKEGIVIGADTVVALENEIFGKPKDEKEAKTILKKLSGKMHLIVTGITIIDAKSKKRVTKSIETKVWFRHLTSSEISNYIQREKPFDKAGAYAMQDLGSIFIKKIEGDYFGAVGLPLFALAKELKKFGITVL